MIKTASVDTTAAAAAAPQAHAWADGFGVWHVRVSRTPGKTTALMQARQALEDEITMRDSHAHPSTWLRPVVVPSLSNEQTIVFREGKPTV